MTVLCFSFLILPLHVLQLYSPDSFPQPLNLLLLLPPISASLLPSLPFLLALPCSPHFWPLLSATLQPHHPLPLSPLLPSLRIRGAVISEKGLEHPFGLALCFLSLGRPPPSPRSANHSFPCQPANWFILPPSQLSLPCRNEAISPRRRLPVAAASTQIMRAGIINEDKVPAARAISPTAPLAAASFIIRLSCRRKLLNPDPCIRALY